MGVKTNDDNVQASVVSATNSPMSPCCNKNHGKAIITSPDEIPSQNNPLKCGKNFVFISVP
ncbi:hypothetical protein VIN01S_27530 [Vibrio inusitatus NBRC 102082]|uniref:Uncharacterized protein n=1 Tax=Vibrio inusitatus NBRC 102082 TaxID=1219070 RepID=A0A4Y3HXP8_9VIBR|nr:hypothetical protein VIN01S_27530 [Vibrio inusitatus NBRC 102082]